jgi:Ni/Co efflux regulator RcnB
MIKRLGGAILGLALVLGALGATGTTAEAKNDKDKDQRSRNGKWDRDREARRGRDNDGDDRQWRDRNRRDDRERGRGYNNGRYGYPGNNNGRYGNGNNNGRYGNGGYNNNGYELNRGYQQGLSTGASDAQRGQSYNPERSRYYRNASTQDFREGFVRGYDQGYRQYAGYNGGSRSNNSGSVLEPDPWSSMTPVDSPGERQASALACLGCPRSST